MKDPFDQASKVFEKSVNVASEMFDKSMDVASKVFDKSMDAASEAFDKSKSATSGFADSAADFAKRGKIRAQLADVSLEYDRLMKQLGTAVYERVKDDPHYADAHPDLFAEIAKVVQRRQDLEDQLSEIQAADDAAKSIDVTPVEPETTDAPAPAAEEKAEDAQ